MNLRGHEFVARTLVELRRPVTVGHISETLEVGYNPAMYLVRDLRDAGIVVPAGYGAKKRGGGTAPALYTLCQVEADISGRPWLENFLRLWNELLEPESVRTASEQAGIAAKNARVIVKAMHGSGLVRIAGYVQRAGTPTALYAISDRQDAARPKPKERREIAAARWQRTKRARLDNVVRAWGGQAWSQA